MSLTETVSRPSRASYSCPHCQTSFRKQKTLRLHIREDHQNKTGEEQVNTEEVQLGTEETVNQEGETSLEAENESENTTSESLEDPEAEDIASVEIENESEDTSVKGLESPEAEDISPVEITPISYDEGTEKVKDEDMIQDDNQEPSEDIDTVVIDDNSEDESDERLTRSDQDLPILPRNKILKLIENSDYFRNKPTIIKAFEPSFKNFDILDPSLPKGFLVWEQARPSGRHVDKEFLSPDGQFVLRSKVAAAEYSKMILSHLQSDGEEQMEVRRGRGRAVKKRSVVSVSPEPKRARLSSREGGQDGGNFRYKLRARLASTISRSQEEEEEEEDLMVLSSSLPASTRIKFRPAPSITTRAGVTITQVPSSKSTRRTRKKIKCCDLVFVTTAGFESHRVKKHSNIRKNSTVRRAKPGLAETQKGNQKVDYSCEYCEEQFSSSAELSSHDKTKHKYKCTICKEAFVSKLSFLEHTKANHIVPCQYCKQVFNSEDKLRVHHEKHHSFQCKNCEEIFKVSSSLFKHVSEKHQFHCSFCPKIVDSAEALLKHTEADHRHCETCEDDFYWPDLEHGCFYTRSGTRPATDRVIVQRLYRGYFFFSADD